MGDFVFGVSFLHFYSFLFLEFSLLIVDSLMFCDVDF